MPPWIVHHLYCSVSIMNLQYMMISCPEGNKRSLGPEYKKFLDQSCEGNLEKKQTVSLKTSLNIEIIHTCGPIHQQFNWLPKLTRSCSLLQVALLTLRPLVSSPLEVGVNRQLNDTHLIPFLSSFLSFLSVCLQARCFHSVQRPPQGSAE